MRQLLRLLLYLAAGAVLYAPSTRSSYFESAPTCGYSDQGFVHFEQSPELLSEPSLGVCGWGFEGISRLQPRVDLCVSCSFTPADRPTCRNGGALVRHPEWHLAQQQDCNWQGCWFGKGACSNGTAESSAVCEDGSANLNCCPFKRYVRCCTMVSCTRRSSPAGQCVVGEKDLLPGQQFVGRLFAVPTASTDCYPYSYESSRVCRSDRTFLPETVYDSCETRAVGRDAEGCAKVPGYTFHRSLLVTNPHSWRIDDGTHWSSLNHAASAQQAAAHDMPLMAARCNALDSCAAFQNSGNSTDLLYQLPTRNYWVEAEASEAQHCYGIYEKSPPLTVCPRISGYLFIPLHTLDTAADSTYAVPDGTGPCTDCADSSALAFRCDMYGGACAGFSNYHGLITGSDGLLSDQPLKQYTSTPCVGMYMRAGKYFPQEVEQLDRLLCGELAYCSSSQLRYHANGKPFTTSSASYYVDLTVDIYADYMVPRGLQDASGGSLRQLPGVRSIVFRCLNGSSMLGGLPTGLAALMPFLQEFRVQGCGATGALPALLAQLRYLRALDLSQNSLSGQLPEQWGNMTLGYLNLSSNQLAGTLPTAWRDILTPLPAAPPPPPPPPPAGELPLPTASAAAAARRESQWGLLVADLSINGLEGEVDRDYVYDSCVRRELRIHFQGEPSAGLKAAMGDGDSPTFLLQYNPGIAVWSGRYDYAAADLARGLSGGKSNMCGAYQYKIALGVLWGVFGVALIAIVVWSAYLAWKAARASRRGRFFITDMGSPSASADSAVDGASEGGAAAAGASRCAAASGIGARLAGALRRLWGKRWFRRVALLLRVGYLVADVALDIRVTVWLFNDGDSTSSAVCLAFIIATQVAVSAAVLASLAHHFFSSRLLVVLLSPVLVAVGPVVGPVLAFANIRNPDVPLVFWRYLELMEFSVALLQAPAESVTQSIVYAHHNMMGNGMYMEHALFIASIILSLGDMLIATLKLCRYKRGPLRRIQVALTHLDRLRDPVDYRKPLLSKKAGGGYEVDSYFLDPPLTSSLALAGAAATTATAKSPEASRSQVLRLGPGPLLSPTHSAGGGGSGYVAPEGGWMGEEEPQPRSAAAVAEPSSDDPPAANTAAGSPGISPLTAPRYRPSLLSPSSQRLAAGGVGGQGLNTLSRLGPSGSARTSTTAIPSTSSFSSASQPPLRPLTAVLPATPTGSSRFGPRATSGQDAEAEAGYPAAASHSQARTWSDTSEAEPATTTAGAAATSGSLDRQSRSLQGALPSHQQPPSTAQHNLVGSISSEVYGSAATGGHGPPPPPPPPPSFEAETLRRSSGGAQSSRSSSRFSDARRRLSSTHGATLPPTAEITSASQLAVVDDAAYLDSAAAAAAAALGDDAAGPGSGLGPGYAAPAGLVVSPGRASTGSGFGSPSPTGAAGSSPTPNALRHVSSLAALRSANVSPARRREGPLLSIAVPLSPVLGQGIEVIRLSGVHHLSPHTSRGAPTPVSMLPPPPQFPRLPPLPQRGGSAPGAAAEPSGAPEG